MSADLYRRTQAARDLAAFATAAMDPQAEVVSPLLNRSLDSHRDRHIGQDVCAGRG
jgi:hypothetical protein